MKKTQISVPLVGIEPATPCVRDGSHINYHNNLSLYWNHSFFSHRAINCFTVTVLRCRQWNNSVDEIILKPSFCDE